MHVLKWQIDFQVGGELRRRLRTFPVRNHRYDDVSRSRLLSIELETGSSESAPQAADMAGFLPSLHSLDLQIDDLTDPEASQDGLHPRNWCDPVHLDRLQQPDSEVRDACNDGAATHSSNYHQGTQLQKESMDCSTEVGLTLGIVVLYHTLVHDNVIPSGSEQQFTMLGQHFPQAAERPQRKLAHEDNVTAALS